MMRYAKVILSAAILLGLALLSVWWWGGERSPEDRALARRRIAAQILGEYLQTQFPRSRVLIVSNPYAREAGRASAITTFEKAAIEGLKDGWGRTISWSGIAYPALRPDARDNPGMVPMKSGTKTPLSYLTAPGSWDNLRETHTNIDVVVSLIGLPMDLAELALWRSPRPPFALLFPDLSLIGDATAVSEAFRSGKLCGAVLDLPSPPPDSIPREPEARAEFAKRFLLVTPQNYRQVMSQYPVLF